MKANDKIIKVCGMRESQNIRDVISLRPDYIGFIFYAPSKRNAIGIEKEIFNEIPEYTIPVGVFVDSSIEEISNVTSFYGIRTVQLHGKETPEMCMELKKRDYKIIKAFPISSEQDDIFDQMRDYVGGVDLLLFDTAGKMHGGNGIKFDWSILRNYPLEIPYILSGGISMEDLYILKQSLPHRCIGIDVNSRFEIEPGLKDVHLLENFIKEYKS